MHYKSAAIGGTFDRIHIGHEALLAGAFAVAEQVTIGLTTDAFVATRKPVGEGETGRQPFAVRKVKLEEWLNAHRYFERAVIVPLDDDYGPTVIHAADAGNGADLDRIVAESFDVLVVSAQTVPGASAINAKRREQGLPPLPVEVVPMVSSEDGQPVSSTRERRGDIDGNGLLIMPAPLKALLSKPMGPVVTNDDLPRTVDGDRRMSVVGVGDEIVAKLVTYGIMPSLAVVDLQSRRRPYDWQTEAFAKLTDGAAVVRIQSGPGYISEAAREAISHWATSGRRTVIVVSGEEDLLTLPVISRAPYGTVVYYGQPNEGAVRVAVDDSARRTAGNLLARFLNGFS
jgi:pantetheine-phosphate adenylyltransferase